MIKILRIIFSITTLILSIIGLITENFELIPFMMLFLSLTMLTLGIQEIQQNKKLAGWFLIGVFAFTFYVSINGFVLNSFF
ncbi:DUF3953 domain-containing protein [Jeotgalibacillus sp. R-1-5s-1]|uniref:DUF3953 domain-containing protein n=1 Tax=Jeotgalibacillus sp. R-1-5s-1 TaxID=2555897 RepID=UPI00106B8A2C|nr:DUF3953 domain-containing protein [Jeotgalibacillus sp. R-1-5s-1]TFD93680.1 DUF3953 domain-containing protein [Jeotgalibacillus sp. R-1-5s-1]